jgi:hypothetical protein
MGGYRSWEKARAMEYDGRVWVAKAASRGYVRGTVPPSGTDAPSDGRIALLLLGREDSYRVLIQCILLSS